MRIDKFLKAARIIKRRTVANDACTHNRVTINGSFAKPSKIVKVGDVISVQFGHSQYTIKVAQIPKGNTPKDKAIELYDIVEHTK